MSRGRRGLVAPGSGLSGQSLETLILRFLYAMIKASPQLSHLFAQAYRVDTCPRMTLAPLTLARRQTGEPRQAHQKGP